MKPLYLLPAQATTFIGRAADIAQAIALLRDQRVRLLTLSGPAGVGKTRLALVVAELLRDAFCDDVAFVDLAPLDDPDLVLPAIARVVGVTDAPAATLTTRLQEFFAQRRCLLILDNAEQVLAAGADVSALLSSAPPLTLLVTSREPLHLRWERELPVQPFAVPSLAEHPSLEAVAQAPAVALFIARAQAVAPTFVLTPANVDDVVAICRRLDGLPLAIELAATRSKLLSPHALRERLSHRLAMLTGGPRDQPIRQQTLRAAIDWSYDLLSTSDQQRFRQLGGVFAGSFTLAAAEAVATAPDSPAADMLNCLGTLLDKSLLQRDARAPQELRFHLLETIREYARDRLVASGEFDVACRRHAAFYLAWAEGVAGQFRHPGQQAAQTILNAERANLRAALRWSIDHDEAELGMRLVAALRPWFRLSTASEGRCWAETLLALPSAVQATAARAAALYTAGSLAWFVGELPAARTRLEESIRLWRALVDDIGLAHALLALIQVPLAGDAAALRRYAQESLALFKQQRDAFGEALVSLELGNLELREADTDAAQMHYQRSGALFHAQGHRAFVAVAKFSMGRLAFEAGDDTTARARYEESLPLLAEVDDRRNMAQVLTFLGQATQPQGFVDEAAGYFAAGLSMAQQVGEQLVLAAAIEGLAWVAAEHGEVISAVLCYAGAARMRALGNVPVSPRVAKLNTLAFERLRCVLGDSRFAAAWSEGDALSREQLQREALRHAHPVQSDARPAPTLPRSACLTQREIEVMRQLAKGGSNTEIGRALIISTKTVERHLANIYAKIGARSRVDASNYAVHNGLL